MLHQNSVFHGVMKQVPWHRFEPIVAQARDGRSKYNIPIWSGQINSKAIAEVERLSAGDQEQIARTLLSHVEKLRVARGNRQRHRIARCGPRKRVQFVARMERSEIRDRIAHGPIPAQLRPRRLFLHSHAR